MVSSAGPYGYTSMFGLVFVVASLYLLGFIVNVVTIQLDKYLRRKKQNKKL